LNSVVERIRAEISARGVIPFARFMELALYCPDCGYYEKEDDSIGRRGDFYTSVSVGSLFGELLAFQFAAWLTPLSTERLQIVETGAHDGQLAADVLRWFQKWRPGLAERVEYHICESSERRRGRQREKLKEFSGRVRWVADDFLRPAGQIHGVIFCNELLDAMPVHRLGWDASRRQWYEWGVLVEGGRFKWSRMEWSRARSGEPRILSRLAELPDEWLEVLPDDFVLEVCPAAEDWWRRAALALRQGWLLTLDYGMTSEERFAPYRTAGTLRGYHRHKHCDDLLANAGGQDLTSHVDFSRIKAAGELAGLKTKLFATQANFFAGVMKEFWPEAERREGWTSSRSREFQTLVHPEHLGRAFRVLVQSRVTTDNQSGISQAQMA